MKRVLICLFMLFNLIAISTALTIINVDINGESSPGVPFLAPVGQYEGGAAGAFNLMDGSPYVGPWNVFVGGWAVQMYPTNIPEGANWQLTRAYLGWDYDIGGFGFSGEAYGLFDDYATNIGPNTPVLSVIGYDSDANQAYSQGFFDVYVYSTEAGTITVNGTEVVLSGQDINDANFNEGANYGVVYAQDSSQWINISFTNQIAGLQLVDRGILVPASFPLPGDTRAGTDFSPTWASFAHEITNISTGPYFWSQEFPPMNLVAETYPGEWLIYDIYVEDANYEGFYEINCEYSCALDNAQIGFSVDDGSQVVVDINNLGNWTTHGWTDFAQGRLYLAKGYHRLKVTFIGAGSNVWGFRIRWADDQNINDCFDAQLAGYTLNDKDFDGNCEVDLKDFAEFASEWLDCINPNGCN